MSFTTDNILAIAQESPDELCAILNAMTGFMGITNALTSICKTNGLKLKKKRNGFKNSMRTASAYNLFQKKCMEYDDITKIDNFAERSRAVSAKWNELKKNNDALFQELTDEAGKLKKAAAVVVVPAVADADADADANAEAEVPEKKAVKNAEKKAVKKAVKKAEKKAEKKAVKKAVKKAEKKVVRDEPDEVEVAIDSDSDSDF